MLRSDGSIQPISTVRPRDYRVHAIDEDMQRSSHQEDMENLKEEAVDLSPLNATVSDLGAKLSQISQLPHEVFSLTACGHVVEVVRQELTTLIRLEKRKNRLFSGFDPASLMRSKKELQNKVRYSKAADLNKKLLEVKEYLLKPGSKEETSSFVKKRKTLLRRINKLLKRKEKIF